MLARFRNAASRRQDPGGGTRLSQKRRARLRAGNRVYPVAKRILDVIAAALGLPILSPVLLAISVAIRVGSPGPVLYRSIRVGMNGKPFTLLKFRTMVVGADTLGGSSTPADDPRLTPVGRWLRWYNLDELPQLINVVRGEMSLVGPRPQVPWAVSRYTEKERVVLSVRPGMTDYASLAFRNEAEILRGSVDPDRDYFAKIHAHKMRLGLKYVNEASFATDLRILALTAFDMVRGGGPRNDGGMESGGSAEDASRT